LHTGVSRKKPTPRISEWGSGKRKGTYIYKTRVLYMGQHTKVEKRESIQRSIKRSCLTPRKVFERGEDSARKFDLRPEPEMSAEVLREVRDGSGSHFGSGLSTDNVCGDGRGPQKKRPPT